MVPRAPVLTNKNSGGRLLVSLAVAGWLIGICSICGCSPPGPRALLRGNQLMAEGRIAEAVAELEKAVVLLPRSALAWNALGLAYHGNHQPDRAVKAYRNALSIDHKLTVVRYNLGCLYLEQTNLVTAIDELRSYTLLQPGAAEGWLRLGTAQMRGRRLEDAERSFRTVLELHPGEPEALNGLGLIQWQRRRWPDALAQFNLALASDPPYPTALLNSAILAHQYLNNRPLALQRYRQYLALIPRPADWEAVESVTRVLERELNPAAPPAPARSAPPAAAVPQPATPPAHRTNLAPAPNLSATRPPAPVVVPPAAAPGPTVRTNVHPPASTNAPAPTSLAGRSVPPSRPPLPSPAPAPLPVPVKPAEVEVSQVQPDLVLKPAQDLDRPTESAADAAANAAHAATNQVKRGLLSRLNPFSGKPRTADADPGTDAGGRTAASADTVLSRPVPRYNYLSPAPPTAGNRAEAEKDFQKGLKAQKNGNRPQAIGEYQAAVRNDPSYYDAYYNLGLAALDSSDVRLSLWAYEIALALKPDAADARYNFALALKSGGYWLDAVEELKRLLAADAGDVRAHLSVANLYAQQLHEPHLARPQYERVLELNPRHPEAIRIRYWLSTNP